MKSKIFKAKTAFWVLGCTLFLLSCNKNFLETQPTDRISETAVWEDIKLAEFFLNGTYANVTSGFNRGWGMLDAGSDDGENSYGWPEVQQFNINTYTPSNTPLNLWGNYYGSIRRTNLILEKIATVPGDEARKTRIKGEANFLRAFFYFELFKQYGGVSVITKSLVLTDDLSLPRNTAAETVNQIISDCDAAAAILPATGMPNGKATKGAALALKAKAILYAASPLFNVKTYTEAAAAAKAVMDLKVYELNPTYTGVFFNEYNKEIIFDKSFDKALSNDPYSGSASAVNIFNTPIGYAGGWGGTGPTQNFVDAYEMTDGKDIKTSPLYKEQDPYKNRDSRFYATVNYEGAIWAGRPIETRVGGLEGMGKNGDATATGYYMRKFLNEDLVSALYSNTGTVNWILLRYAEVLLNYAEAQNEAVGPDASVHSAVDLVRTRAGQPPLVAGLTKEQMREKIRNERRVELAFEEQRFWDIRRWKIAETVVNGPMTGMRITGTPGNLLFTRITFETRTFSAKNYLLPIPQSEIDKNAKLEQNPGY